MRYLLPIVFLALAACAAEPLKPVEAVPYTPPPPTAEPVATRPSPFATLHACVPQRQMPSAQAEPTLDTSRPGWAWSVPGELPGIVAGAGALFAGLFGAMARALQCEFADLSASLWALPAVHADGLYVILVADEPPVALRTRRVSEREVHVDWVRGDLEDTFRYCRSARGYHPCDQPGLVLDLAPPRPLEPVVIDGAYLLRL